MKTAQKICTTCKINKDISEFYKRKDSNQTHRSQCKKCISDKTKIYANSHLEQKNKQSKRYYLENKESIDIRTKAWNKNNPDKIAEYCKTYAKNHPNRVKEKARKYFKTEKGKLSSRNNWSKRRSLKRNQNDNTIDIKYLELLKIKQNNKCFYCECELDFKGDRLVHLDHYMPLSKGGKHSVGNVVFACRDCNLSKGSNIPTKPLSFKLLL